MQYLYIIQKATDGSYSAYVPDLPGCTTCADSLDEVKTSIKDAVDSYVEALREIQQPIPHPTSLADVVEAA